MLKKATRLLAIILLSAAVSACGCERKKDGTVVTLVGSTSVLPFAELLAEKYAEDRDNPPVDPQGGGSTAGIIALEDGIAQIGMCSRSLKKDEAEKYTPHVIAFDGLAIVVHKDNPIKNLTKQQAIDIFTGKITCWDQLKGGENCHERIWVVMREEGSGTREAFVKLVLGDNEPARKALVQESNGAVKEFVRNARGGIGYISVGLVDNTITALKFDGVEATAEEVSAKRYPLVRPFLFVTRKEIAPEVQNFIDYVISPDSQKLLEKEGLVRVK